MDKTIEYITEVARCNGITKAATNLYITPSALSKFIQTRENELGVKLFIRGGKKFSLTYAGQRYVEMLEKLREYEEDITKEMTKISNLYMGKLRIGVQLSLVELMITKVLPEFTKRFPNVQLSLEETGSTKLLALLHKKELDVVLSSYAGGDTEFIYEKVANDRLVLVTSLDSKIAKKAVKKDGFTYPWLDASAYKDEKMIQYSPGQIFRVAADRNCGNNRFTPISDVTIRATRTALICVENNHGYTITSDLLTDQLGYSDKVRKFSYGGTEVPFSMNVIYEQNTMLKEEIGNFAAIVRDNLSSFK